MICHGVFYLHAADDLGSTFPEDAFPPVWQAWGSRGFKDILPCTPGLLTEYFLTVLPGLPVKINREDGKDGKDSKWVDIFTTLKPWNAK